MPMTLSLSESSPRTWGKVEKDIYGFGNVRVIPTHVGERMSSGNSNSTIESHPYACGGKRAPGAK